MDILEIIDKKEKGGELNKAEIDYAVMGYVNGEIPDYQISVLLEVIDMNGMSDKEMIDLTDVMLNSGDKLEFGFESIDKHSTGGVGDKTTIVLAPLVAALGVKVAKMSGRGLGHTGGTIDKLQSISGFQTEMSLVDVEKQVEEIGVALVGQMGNLCPADKKIYALRDATGTVKSIPLIASSIMSKKLASGSSKIVIDLKVGNGALEQQWKRRRNLRALWLKLGI
ncbi:MAG: thymidine phosphorylase [Bacilli bacterium]